MGIAVLRCSAQEGLFVFPQALILGISLHQIIDADLLAGVVLGPRLFFVAAHCSCLPSERCGRICCPGGQSFARQDDRI